MVQKEVAERLAASPGQMSLLSVAVQYYANVEYLFTVPRTAFWPEPRVDSAVVKIIPHLIERVEPQVEHDFFALVKAGFSSRRKILLKNLAGFLGKAQRPLLSAIFSELNLSPLVRAQELSLEQWKKIAFRLSDAKK